MIDRALFDHPRFRPKCSFSKLEAWLWIIAEASWRERRIEVSGDLVTLKRGQLTASYRFMAKKFGWSVKAVRTFVHQLSRDGSIVTETGTGQLLITVCNYESYQVFANYRGTKRAQQGHSRGTQRAQTITPEETSEETPENSASANGERDFVGNRDGNDRARRGNPFQFIAAGYKEGYDDEE